MRESLYPATKGAAAARLLNGSIKPVRSSIRQNWVAGTLGGGEPP